MEAMELNRKENKMGILPEGRLLFTMSLPMVISMLLQALYNIVDSIFVTRISEDALTAVSLAYPIQMLMIAIAVGTGVGMNALISDKDMVVSCAGPGRREYGEQRITEEVERAILARTAVMQHAADGAVLRIVDRAEKPPRALLLVPIIAQGDAIGAVILFSTEEHAAIGEAELKTCQTIASFLGRQMEA